MEANRPWKAENNGLNMEVQNTLTFGRPWKHPHGFSEQTYVHVPYDTLSRLSRLKPQVILSGELGARTLQAAIYKRLHKESRLIIWATVSGHSEQGRGKMRELLRREIVPSADAVLVNGANGARYVERLGVNKDKIFVVPYATDVCQFSALPPERGAREDRRLLHVGQLIERKGLRQFLSVLSLWCEAHQRDTLEFWLVGDGPERAKLEKTLVPANLSLRFWGNIGYGELAAFYGQAGILAFPTLADEWGLVVNEAMSAGLPVLGSVYSQAVEELVKDDLTGWTYRPDHADEMYKALDRALTIPRDKLEEMRLSARKFAENLTPQAVADRILEAIQFVCGDSQVLL